MSIIAVADALDRIGLDIAETVVEIARLDLTKPPAVAQLHQIGRQVRTDAPPERPALSAPPGIPMPDELRRKYVHISDKFSQLETDQARRVEREGEVTSRDEDWKRRIAEAVARPRPPLGCTGGGKVPVERDGTLVCPDCGVEVPNLEVRMPARKRKRAAS